LDLGDEIVDPDLVAFLLGPARERALLHGRGQLRQACDLRHVSRLSYRYRTLRIASSTRAGPTITSCSRCAAYGIGTSRFVARSTGASRKSNASRCTRSTTSAPGPPYSQCSC